MMRRDPSPGLPPMSVLEQLPPVPLDVLGLPVPSRLHERAPAGALLPEPCCIML